MERYSRLGAFIGVVDVACVDDDVIDVIDDPIDPMDDSMDVATAILLILESSWLKSLSVARPRSDGFSINARNDTLMNGDENRTDDATWPPGVSASSTRVSSTSDRCSDPSSSITSADAASVGRCVVGCTWPVATRAATSEGSGGPRKVLSMAATAEV